ncbi:MAG TPA: hypothetical protein HA302_03795 [Thermococcaceae archaeon]|uniref:Uncharacterized protein n=2 Tax=Thermococcus sibiricus TaxID=172049 RepID=C6A1K2_THESM|nr:hypothetical protein [Thermococcus sibiricus]ACS89497.1 hypothetical protein TSIB_0431 [Thermococcus sibiricus MM 739]KUK16927.1 MAG: Uncharacterized protein XD54_1784 [Thermococcus sibiricus]KUK28125.1 MAG: Uncharacterized protein XD61_1334 [Thermococcus sp. 40_45]HII67131.1 hypothetical protein [Thermococcaceae archaeon]
MKEIFKREGVFVEFEEKRVRLENGDEVVHKQEHPTELWWGLKETIKGKRVRLIVYEIEE